MEQHMNKHGKNLLKNPAIMFLKHVTKLAQNSVWGLDHGAHDD